MAARDGVELPVAYATLALTLAATGPGKYKIGPALPGRLAAVGALVGGVAAGRARREDGDQQARPSRGRPEPSRLQPRQLRAEAARGAARRGHERSTSRHPERELDERDTDDWSVGKLDLDAYLKRIGYSRARSSRPRPRSPAFTGRTWPRSASRTSTSSCAARWTCPGVDPGQDRLPRPRRLLLRAGAAVRRGARAPRLRRRAAAGAGRPGRRPGPPAHAPHPPRPRRRRSGWPTPASARPRPRRSACAGTAPAARRRWTAGSTRWSRTPSTARRSGSCASTRPASG